MDTNSSRPSATILAFPAGGRSGISTGRNGILSAANMSARPQDSNVIADNWYHEAAVREADLPKGH